MENRVLLIGDIADVDSIKTHPSGAKSLDFTVRTWSRLPDGKILFEFHPVTVWGDAIDRAEPTLRVGNVVRLDGALHHTVWEDKFGNKRRKTSVRGLLVKPAVLEVPPHEIEPEVFKLTPG